MVVANSYLEVNVNLTRVAGGISIEDSERITANRKQSAVGDARIDVDIEDGHIGKYLNCLLYTSDAADEL